MSAPAENGEISRAAKSLTEANRERVLDPRNPSLASIQRSAQPAALITTNMGPPRDSLEPPGNMRVTLAYKQTDGRTSPQQEGKYAFSAKFSTITQAIPKQGVWWSREEAQ
jgi:hypothetical protein